MTTPQIKELQRRIGVDDDGFWGPISQEGVKSYLRQFMPDVSPWPKSDEKSLLGFYGKPGDTTKHVSLDVSGLGLKYDGKDVTRVTVHNKCAMSLRRVLEKIAGGPWDYVLERYAGVYNNRSMRGGSRPSLHARAAAIDLWPEKNGNHEHWPVVAQMPIEVMELFASEGWLPAGAFWSRDAMHFQATQ